MVSSAKMMTKNVFFAIKFLAILLLIVSIECDDSKEKKKELQKSLKLEGKQLWVLLSNICDDFTLDGKPKLKDDQMNEIMECVLNYDYVSLMPLQFQFINLIIINFLESKSQ